MATRTTNAERRETVRASIDVDEPGSSEERFGDTVLPDASESMHDVPVDIEVDADGQLDIDVSEFE